uniref:ATP synthase subunit a n=1 Tax=Chiropsalmus quadrumanus TaxID=645347 RepID=G9IT39_9CNID|nr:ATP synthase F0 subunit 6 [Chiropsalmus quadrumanus]
MASYFDQFNVILVVGEYFTNVSISILFGVFCLLAVSPSPHLVPNRVDTVWSMLLYHWRELILDNVGKDGIRYLPGILSLFILLLILNLLGFFPYTYTVTAQVVVTFALSFTIVMAVTVEGILKFKMDFFSMWMPQGAPMMLAPLLVVIETVSYFSRALSLGLRLAANISAGHLLMLILGSFTLKLALAGVLSLTLIALIITVCVVLLEVAVAVIQAYVFCLLVCVYLSDTTNLH